MKTMKRLLPVWAIGCCLQASAQPADSILHKSGVKISAAARVTFTGRQVTLRQLLDSCLKIPHQVAPAAYHWPGAIDVQLHNMSMAAWLDWLQQQFPIAYSAGKEMPNVLLITLQPYTSFTGIVTTNGGEPLAGANVAWKGTARGVHTDPMGRFTLTGHLHDTLVYSYAGMQSREVSTPASMVDTIQLNYLPAMKDIQLVNNGYRVAARRFLTGSYYLPGAAALNAGAAYNVLDRLEGWGPHYQVTDNALTGPGLGAVRGGNSFYAGRSLLAVIDYFPWQVNSQFINPDDLERVNYLRDAAAGVIYGYKGSNGVLVASTRQPPFASTFRVSLRSQVTITAAPSLRYQGGIAARDYIALEKQLFDSVKAPALYTMSPAQDIFYRQKFGQLTDAEAARQLEVLAQQDLLADMDRYIYAAGWHLHQGATVEAANTRSRGYLSLSRDHNQLPEKGNQQQRNTLLGKWGFRTKRVETELSLYHARINTTTNVVPNLRPLPYLALADAAGNPLPIPYEIPPLYLETLTSDRLLNWKYYPLQEKALMNNTGRHRLTQWFARAVYHFGDSALRAEAMMQGVYASYRYRQLHTLGSYFTRHLINSFMQPDSYPVPKGAIADENSITSTIHNMRAQLSYTRRKGAAYWVAYGGVEARLNRLHYRAGRTWGVGTEREGETIDYNRQYLPNGGSGRLTAIPYYGGNRDSADNYLGYYINGNLTLLDRINLSVGVRKDMTNHFARENNKMARPLWAVGASMEWRLARGRVSYGQTGNIDYTIPPFATLTPDGSNQAGAAARLNQLPATDLTYERQNMLNAGLDIGHSRRIAGSIDYYHKWSKNLVVQGAVNPLRGNAVAKSNTGAISGWGMDISLHTGLWRNKASFYTEEEWLYGYTTHTIRSRMESGVAAWWYTTADQYQQGRPVNAVYAYRFAGLTARGAPMGWYNNQQSVAYEQIMADTAATAMAYMGTSTPAHYGSFVQTLHWGPFLLRYMLVVKAGYVLRKRALHYWGMYYQQYAGTSGYYARWRQPGDEKTTDVPGIPTVLNKLQDDFYQYSAANVVKGDHLRLHLVQLEYEWKRKDNDRPHFVKRWSIGLSVYNLGILWRANKYRLDPDAGTSGYPASRSTTFTCNALF